jgi:hypothetical protein
LFIVIGAAAVSLAYLASGTDGLAAFALAFFLPLYLVRVLIWSFWPRLHASLSTNLTPTSWITSMFALWESFGAIGQR